MAEKEAKMDAGPSPAREKVLRHLKTAAVAGASLAMACRPGAGGKGQGSHNPQEPQKPGEHKDGPPLVCDPLPPPLNCDMASKPGYLNTFLYREAKWVLGPRGWTVELRLEVAGWTEPQGLDFAADPKVKGAEVLKVTKEGRKRVLSLLPAKGAKSFTVELPMLCGGRPAELKLDVDTTAAPSPGAQLEVRVTQK